MAGGRLKPRDLLSPLERDALDRWRAGATHVHFGLCADCQRTHDDDGKPLLVARQARSRRFLCLSCWDAKE